MVNPWSHFKGHIYTSTHLPYKEEVSSLKATMVRNWGKNIKVALHCARQKIYSCVECYMVWNGRQPILCEDEGIFNWARNASWETRGDKADHSNKTESAPNHFPQITSLVTLGDQKAKSLPSYRYSGPNYLKTITDWGAGLHQHPGNSISYPGSRDLPPQGMWQCQNLASISDKKKWRPEGLPMPHHVQDSFLTLCPTQQRIIQSKHSGARLKTQQTAQPLCGQEYLKALYTVPLPKTQDTGRFLQYFRLSHRK